MYSRIIGTLGINSTLLSLSVSRAIEDFGTSMLFITIPIYVINMKSLISPTIEPILSGILISLYGLLIVILLPFIGVITDRLGTRKPFIVGGLLITFIGTLGFIFIKNFYGAIIMRSIQGLGAAATISSAMAMVSVNSINTNRGKSFGTHSAIRKLGDAAGPLVGGPILMSLGVNAAFALIALVFLVSAYLIHILIKENHKVANDAIFNMRQTKKITKIPTPILFLGLSTLIVACSFSMITSLENQINTRLNQSVIAFGVAFGTLTLIRIPLEIPMGRLADNIGKKPVIICGLLLMAVATISMGLIGSTLHLILLRGIQGIAAAMIFSPAFALAADNSKDGDEGRDISILPMGYYLGITFGPLLASFLSLLSFLTPFVVIGIVSIIGSGIIYFCVREFPPIKSNVHDQPFYK
jgi:MFS family permease